MPTTVPTEIQELFDASFDLNTAFGIATLVIIFGITAWKYVRGLS